MGLPGTLIHLLVMGIALLCNLSTSYHRRSSDNNARPSWTAETKTQGHCSCRLAYDSTYFFVLTITWPFCVFSQANACASIEFSKAFGNYPFTSCLRPLPGPTTRPSNSALCPLPAPYRRTTLGEEYRAQKKYAWGQFNNLAKMQMHYHHHYELSSQDNGAFFLS